MENTVVRSNVAFNNKKNRIYGERIDSGEDKILGDFTTEPTHAGNLK